MAIPRWVVGIRVVSLRAADREQVLERQEVEDVEPAVAVEVCLAAHADRDHVVCRVAADGDAAQASAIGGSQSDGVRTTIQVGGVPHRDHVARRDVAGAGRDRAPAARVTAGVFQYP